MNPLQVELDFSGTAQRDYGMALVEAATDDAWQDQADAAIVNLARTGRRFTAEDVRDLVGEPPRINSLGPRFMAAIRQGIIKHVDFTRAKRPSAHARALAVYTGCRG
jgi:hypothetical protein